MLGMFPCGHPEASVTLSSISLDMGHTTIKTTA